MNKNNSIKDILKRIYSHLEKQRKQELVKLFLLSILSSISETISIAILIPFISIFINPDTYLANDYIKFFLDLFSIENTNNLLGLISLIFILVVIISAFLKIKFVKLTNKLSQNISSDFRVKLFDFFINQNFSYVAENGSNKIMTTILAKSKYNSLLALACVNILNSILLSSAILGMLIYVEPKSSSLMILSTLIFFYLFYKIKSVAAYKMGEEANVKLSFMMDIFTNVVGYLPEIILYNIRKFYFKIFKDTSVKIADLQAGMSSISMNAKYYYESFVLIFVVLLIYMTNLSDRSLESNISYFAILAFAAQKCLPLINGIYKSAIQFKSAMPLVYETLDILDDTKFNLKLDDKIIETKNDIQFKNKIKLENIKYKYRKDLPNILNNINFEINKGDKVLIKGRTGSGKSTLINIILGLINANEGKLIVDDVVIDETNQKNWQKNIAFVPQNIFLNNATILENIAIGENLREINLEKIYCSTKIAQIDTFIDNLPEKYYEKTGERGLKLSGGQKQRLGIARALYRNSNLIVLDEPTNALDEETEQKILSSIKNLKLTVIMVSHTNSSHKFFNKIIDLSNFK